MSAKGDDMYCKHGRTEEVCEECVYEKAKAAGMPVPPVMYQPTSDPADETPTPKARKR